MGLFGNFGLTYEYNSTWVGRHFTTEGGLIGVTMMPSVSYKINKSFSVGAGLKMVYGQFETESAVNTLSPGDGKLEFEDDTFGFGVDIGVLYEVNEATRFGLNYTSEVELDFEDTLEISGIAIIGSLSRNIDLDFDMPQTIMASFFHDVDKKWSLMGNLGWENWSEFGKIGLQVDTNPPSSYQTVNRNYDDTWHGAVGTQYRYSDTWLLSFGVAYDTSMVDDQNRTPDLPVGDMWRFSIGGQYQWSKDLVIGFGYTLVWEGDLVINQQKTDILGRTETLSGVYEDVNLHFFAINFKW
jgi:long-chain fatty acid transport protein